MNRIVIVVSFFVACGCFPIATNGQSPDVPALVAEFTAAAESKPRSPAELAAAFDAILDSLMPGMTADKLEDREKPQQTLERICHRAGRPGAEIERAALCSAIAKRLASTTAKPARVWMLRKLEPLGKDECVAALMQSLADGDVEIRDAARRALQSNPAAAARDALLTALDAAGDAAVRVGLINALAARRDAGLSDAFVKQMAATDDETAVAAMTALGEIGSESALPGLIGVWGNSPPQRRRAAGAAISRISERLVTDGKSAQAVPVYTSMYELSPLPHVKAAALIGLARSRGEGALPLLRETYLKAETLTLRPIAARIAAGIPGPAITSALADDLAAASPDVQIVLLDGLADRGDKSALKAMANLAASEDEAIRVAAVSAMARLGGPELIEKFASIAGSAAGATQRAARDGLATLRGADVDEALLVALRQRADGKAIAEYAKALAARRHKPAVPALFDVLEMKDADVQSAAFEALAELADAGDVPKCVRALTQCAVEARPKAEDMLATVCLRNSDKEARVKSLLDELHSGDVKSHPSLIRVLGRLEGTYALAAVRQAAGENGNAELSDAGVRALSGWSSADVLPDLERIVGDAASLPVHRTLALRGLTRLIRLPSDRTPEQTFALLEKTWKQCERSDERKLILAALPNVRCVAALKLAATALDDSGLKDEAATAVVALARGLALSDRALAEQTVRSILDRPVSEKPKAAAKEALDWFDAFDGYISDWQFCGPYTCKGKNSGTLFDVAFPPEPGSPKLPPDSTGPATAAWKPLNSASPANPWIMDFTRMDKGVSRCIYVKATIISDADKPARLDIGSDDGVEVWLNENSVHKKIGIRPVTPGEDKVTVALRKGDNPLLLKIAQGDGGWGVCCGIRAPDGAKMAGVTFRAE